MIYKAYVLKFYITYKNRLGKSALGTICMKYKVEAKHYIYKECLVGGIYDLSNATLMRHLVPIIGFYKGV